MTPDVVPVLERDPDVLCAKSCHRVATLSVELDSGTDGTPVAELWCGECFDDYESRRLARDRRDAERDARDAELVERTTRTALGMKAAADLPSPLGEALAVLFEAMKPGPAADGCWSYPLVGWNADEVVALAEAVLETVEDESRPCPCGGTRWTDDENWSPEFPGDRPQPGGPGRLPCGFCNHGGWDVDDPYVPSA